MLSKNKQTVKEDQKKKIVVNRIVKINSPLCLSFSEILCLCLKALTMFSNPLLLFCNSMIHQEHNIGHYMFLDILP